MRNQIYPIFWNMSTSAPGFQKSYVLDFKKIEIKYPQTYIPKVH
jgi:hypothetical protein